MNFANLLDVVIDLGSGIEYRKYLEITDQRKTSYMRVFPHTPVNAFNPRT